MPSTLNPIESGETPEHHLTFEELEVSVNRLKKQANLAWEKTQSFTTKLESEIGPNSDLKQECEQHLIQLRKLWKETKKLTGNERVDMINNLGTVQQKLEECLALQPRTGSWFVELFLGKVNLVVYSHDQRILLRSEYLRFKKVTTFIYVLFPLFLMFYSPTWTFGHLSKEVLDTLWHVWLLYYYVTMTVRENILRINGSRINSWWIWHHYICILIAGCAITFPKGHVYTALRSPGMKYLICQGLVQGLQTSYQKRRLYARRALGLVSSMDVPETDTLVHNSHSLWLLLPFLLALQLTQLYAAMYVLNIAYTEKGYLLWPEFLSTAVLGTLCLTLAFGNFYTTLLTLLHKKEKSGLLW